ncbi:TRICHOME BIREFRINGENCE-LIKE 41 [Artemisia annua]|uniref:TRICHOME BIREFRINGENCE-LIKE 41 n=1 Tax=Artemisia annua TaxID=35608 RepID=A0A2U1MV76_ARTAN|nr:TRICHOME BIREFRINGENCE-LIKE 41 [Artemisia annua]
MVVDAMHHPLIDAKGKLYAVNISLVKDMTTYTFTDYNVKVTYHHNLYLVEIVKQRFGRVLKLDVLRASKLWLDVTTSYLTLGIGGTVDEPANHRSHIYKDMDRVVAFGKVVVTWVALIGENQRQNPTPDRKSSLLLASTYPGVLPPALAVLKSSLKTIKKPVTLLDITNLSLLWKDGHPSDYGLGAVDCNHWCLVGVPDTWNVLLYNLMF